MIRQQPSDSKIEMFVVTDEAELREAQERHEQFKQNSDWLQANVPEVYSKHRGRFICIAGQELFVADTVQDAIAEATTAHPGDKGWFTRFIPLEKIARIYAV